ncbi:hypothetical protein FHS54_001275 [Sphingobium vermicomposti]|uniref:Uncharacterized protein n=1 Tax=Sphingobium vermicomposti TaxID=529005 RepID=A0A846M303_9SPHN|nr:hypothetical protein [Sphingobium vermicomposti]
MGLDLRQPKVPSRTWMSPQTRPGIMPVAQCRRQGLLIVRRGGATGYLRIGACQNIFVCSPQLTKREVHQSSTFALLPAAAQGEKQGDLIVGDPSL